MTHKAKKYAHWGAWIVGVGVVLYTIAPTFDAPPQAESSKQSPTLSTHAPLTARAFAEQGKADYQQGQYEKAVANLEKALELDPTLFREVGHTLAKAYDKRGLAYYNAGQFGKAMGDFVNAVWVSAKGIAMALFGEAILVGQREEDTHEQD